MYGTEKLGVQMVCIFSLKLLLWDIERIWKFYLASYLSIVKWTLQIYSTYDGAITSNLGFFH